MPWTEILPSDAAGIANFVTVQRQATSWYQANFDAARMARYFVAKRSCRAFFYTDANYKITLMTCLTPANEVRILTAGLQTVAAVSGSTAIMAPKVLSVVGLYGIKTWVAKLPTTGTLGNTTSFFNAILANIQANSAAVQSFTATVLTNFTLYRVVLK